MILLLFHAVITLQCPTTPHKRALVVIDYFVHYTQLNILKMTSLIAVYHVGTFYHLQWLMLALFRLLNAFYPTLIRLLLHIVRIFNLL